MTYTPYTFNDRIIPINIFLCFFLFFSSLPPGHSAQSAHGVNPARDWINQQSLESRVSYCK